jgi:chromatin assembly factor 1 subunit B
MAATAAVRVATPEIRLHCGPTGLNEAVLSLDFLQPAEGAEGDATDKPLLATGGADKEIKLWRVGGDTALEFVFSLSGHDRSVNCVRFSPDGVYLASASDDTSIILWSKPKTAGDDWRWDQISSLSDVGRKILSLGHKGDITDLSWSPDSAFLCSSSVDNRCVIWDVEKGDVAERRKDHTQYVQGVAWDPLNEFLVTEGNDRTCRVYSLSGFGAATRPNGKKQSRKFMCLQTLKTREFPSKQSDAKPSTAATAKEDKEDKESTKTAAAEATPDTAAKPPPAPKHRMFLDDTCPAFARRPAWTPDGSYFLAPTGTFHASESASPVNTVYAFSRGNLSQPTLHLPGQEKASLGVRCSPVMYELRRQEGQADNSPTPNFFKTPFRSVFAVITLDAVVIHDTQVTRSLSLAEVAVTDHVGNAASAPDLHGEGSSLRRLDGRELDGGRPDAGHFVHGRLHLAHPV